ncbi:hypothetical protein F4804DRAFT_321860 [Jackrogersella minutella]|nr:hypothetical protein F4804DRAFT_321860 [Jackrogersella minutella]
MEFNRKIMQRNIFDWYEKNKYEIDAGSIFSPEWEGRLIKWGKEFDGNSMPDICEKIKSHKQNPQDLELGCIFQADPVAAFALWHVLQSCYELDRIIYGTTMQNRTTISEWLERRPFQYLLSEDIASCWQKNLSALLSEADSCTDKFQKENIHKRLQRISQATDVLNEHMATLGSVFEGRKEEPADTFWMVKVVQENVEKRWPAMAGT